MRMGGGIGRPQAPIGVEAGQGDSGSTDNVPTPVNPQGETIDIAELTGSREYSRDRDGAATMTRVFMLKKTDDPIVAATFPPVAGMAFAGGLVAQRDSYEILEDPGAQGANVGIVKKTVEYKTSEESGTGAARPTDEFSLEHESVTIREMSLWHGAQVHYPTTDSTAPKTIGNLIGRNRWSKDGETEGAPVQVPIRTLVMTRFSTPPLKTSQMRTTDALSPGTNASPWNGFSTGEVLFLGANPTFDPKLNKWRWVYTFKIRANRLAADNGTISVGLIAKADGTPKRIEIAKKGWEYLWYEIGRDQTKEGSGPIYAHVAQVYPERNFNALNLTPAEPDKWTT